MYKRKALLLLGISLVLLVGLLFLTQAIDKAVDNRFSQKDQPAPVVDSEQTQEESPVPENSTEENPLPEDETQVADPIPQKFLIYDTNNQPVSLYDFSNRPVVLYFWTSHSKSSTAGLSLMERYFQKHGNKVYFVVVNVVDGEKETRQTSDAFLAKKNYSFPIYYDLDGLCNEYYGKKVPLAVFFGSDGKAVTYFNEQPTTSLMQTCFQKILN